MSLKKLSKAEKEKMKSRIVESGKLSELLGSAMPEKRDYYADKTSAHDIKCYHENKMIEEIGNKQIRFATVDEVATDMVKMMMREYDSIDDVLGDLTPLAKALHEKYYIIPKEGK